MQANQSAVVWTLGIGFIALLILGGYTAYSINSKLDANNNAISKLPSKTDVKVSVPSAEEIAASVVVPSYDDTDVLVGLYPAKANALKWDCIHGLQLKFTYNEIRNDIRDLIEAEIGKEIKDFSVIDWNYGNDFKFTIFDLGIDNEESRSAELTDTMRVQYRLVDGNDDLIKKRIYVVANCAGWDDRDNEFETLAVSYSI